MHDMTDACTNPSLVLRACMAWLAAPIADISALARRPAITMPVQSPRVISGESRPPEALGGQGPAGRRVGETRSSPAVR